MAKGKKLRTACWLQVWLFLAIPFPAWSQDQSLMERIAISSDQSGFVRVPSMESFRVWGVNYDHDDRGRLIEDYWHDEWDRIEEDFEEIRALGANVVRIHLQTTRFMSGPKERNERNLERLRQLVRLAETKGLYLDLTGLACYHRQDVAPWYVALGEGERWETQAEFWRAVASVGRGSPAIFCYDLMNEPILPSEKPAEKAETDWLTGELDGKTFVQRVTLDLKGRTRIEVARAWVAQMVAAIREVDTEHLTTVGVIPWSQVFPGAKPIFYAPDVHGPLDFVSIHFYPKGDDTRASLAALEAYRIGKPLVIEEIFPLSASIESTDAFMSAAGDRVAGWISFYWGATPEENDAKQTLAGTITAVWLRHFRQHAGKR